MLTDDEIGQQFNLELTQLVRKYKILCEDNRVHPKMLYFYLEDIDLRPFKTFSDYITDASNMNMGTHISNILKLYDESHQLSHISESCWGDRDNGIIEICACNDSHLENLIQELNRIFIISDLQKVSGSAAFMKLTFKS